MPKIGEDDNGFFVDQDFLPAFDPLTGGKIRKGGRRERIIEVRLIAWERTVERKAIERLRALKSPGMLHSTD